MSRPVYTSIRKRDAIVGSGQANEVDIFCSGLSDYGIEYQVYDRYDDMQVSALDKPENEPFDEYDIVVVISDSDMHYFFADGRLLGSAVLETHSI